METSSKVDSREARFRRGHSGVCLASVLLLLLFLWLNTSLGQESQHEAYREARAWLDFNHHLGGVIVLVLAGLTCLELLESGPLKVIRLGWPMCLIVIGFYNVILSDRFAWPIDPSGFMESLSNPEVLQHKILAVMVLMLGLIELLRRLQLLTHRSWLYLFYGLAVLTGGILLGHDFDVSHQAHSHGFSISHVVMGLLALLALVFKILVDHRMILGRLAYLYPLCLAGLGMQLLLFTEPSMIAP
jgi:copper resistance protein D